MKNKAVFLDRDGTLIIDKVYLNDPEKIEYLPGVFEGMRKLAENGYLLLVATNQSGVARGIVSLENLAIIHQILQKDFTQAGAPIAGFYFAPYMTDSGHPMRKPEPGMLQAGARDHNIDLQASWMVGDRMTDVEAGHRAGARTILLPGEDDVTSSPYQAPFARASHFLEAVDVILKAPVR